MKKKAIARAKAQLADRQAFVAKIRDAYLAKDLEPMRTNGGLGFVIHEQGEGKPAKRGKVAEVHYIGLLASDGYVFDESFSGGRSIKFSLGRGEVIGGWDIGIGLLSVGDKATLFLPPALGYGKEGVEDIPGDSELIFYVELLGIS